MKLKTGRYGIALYTKQGIGILGGHGGTTYGPFIFIREKYLQDRGLLEHELVHTRQFWNPLKWFKGRLWWEIEAYREQAKWYPDDRLPLFAKYLATRYSFNITEEQALNMLRGTP